MIRRPPRSIFFFNDTATTEIYTLSLHDALPISHVDPGTHVVVRDGQAIGLEVDGVVRLGFPTPSRKLEFFSRTLKEWKWPAEAVPSYIRSHVHWSKIDRARGEMVLLPTFRLPTLIHTRSGNSKWLYEISHTNPLWLHPEDAAPLGVTTGDLPKVTP